MPLVLVLPHEMCIRDRHHVAQQGFSLFGSFVNLAVRPDGGGEVLRIFHDIIGIGTEEV